jgi:hypothetical protein
VPEDQRKDFIFHATDLYHGGGPVFDRRKYPIEKSHAALKELLAIPSRFKLPVAIGYIKKQDNPTTRAQIRHSASYHHALASIWSVVTADEYLRNKYPNELAIAIAEDNTVTKKAVQGLYELLKVMSAGEGFGTVHFELRFPPGLLPIRKILSGFHFVSKRDEMLLQLADACTFTTRCWLQQKDKSVEFWEALTQNRPVIGMEQPEGGNGLIYFE